MNPPVGKDSSPLSEVEFHILLALADGNLHGYGIMQQVGLQSGGRVRMGPGTLYGAIKRMLRDGLVEESDDRPASESDDQRRRYYRVTALGRRTAEVEALHLADLLKTAVEKRFLKRSAILNLTK
jgi:DNA-binding PadR family transcriptional regulator